MCCRLYLLWPLLIFVSSVLLNQDRLVSATDDDLYELLGITKDADDRTIRRAFKKLAIKLHPDKNTGDPNAHDKFVKINRAYEVLKDEELRKKYDLYGEAGLKDDFHGGHQYQSWQFYNDNFGIYDEDPEIVTLSRSDFEQSVLRSEDKWFINFYSTQCSHCHELAPTWRLMARELEGAVRIGAVNCGDDWMLCREQGIFGYPSLVFYPAALKYAGAREKDQLVEFAMRRLSVSVHHLTTKNKKEMNQKYSPLPWLVDFCDEAESCLSALNRKKLAAMLEGLVNIGTVDCTKEGQSLCKELDVQYGVYFFEERIYKGNMKKLESFDAKELASKLLSFLPELPELTSDSFYELEENILNEIEQPWLVHFVSVGNADLDLELKKLPAMLKDVKIARINCTKTGALCNDLHFYKQPVFAVFKSQGGYEIHHGRHTAHDVAAFARDCASTNVRALSEREFEDFIWTRNGDNWFIDFFAPWCPPCMKLLPEFRKAARELGEELKFGTVDCTVHQGLCQRANVHTYPTTILYNQSEPHSFVGLHSVDELITFVQVLIDTYIIYERFGVL